MNKKYDFVTLFPDCPNFGLTKDVGQIPYSFAKYYGWNVLLASSKIDISGINVKEYGVDRIHVIKNYSNNDVLAGIFFLLKNAKRIERLNLYHCKRSTLIWSFLFKFLNPKGKVYVKLDAGFTTLEKIRNDSKYRKLFITMCKKADLVSAESKVIAEELNEISGKTIEVIPNGFVLEDDDSQIVYSDKQDNFLTVGRIGATEKNNDLLLEAFAKISDKCDWNLVMVGKVKEDFQKYVQSYFIKYPSLINRVRFMDEVSDRKQLSDVYRQSKVFVMPSKYESFSIATVEALASGCYLVLSSEVTPKEEFTNAGKYGTVVPVDDLEKLADAMLMASQKAYSQELTDEMQKYAVDKFSWENICKKIYQMLQKDEV